MRYFIKIIAVAFFLIAINESYSQGLNKRIKKIADLIAIENIVQGPAIGFAGSKSDQYKRFEKILIKGDLKDFVGLSNHPSATVRCYGLWAILVTDSITYQKEIKRFTSDTSTVEFQSGCVIREYTVFNLFSQKEEDLKNMYNYHKEFMEDDNKRFQLKRKKF